MTSYGEQPCKLCGRTINDGDEITQLNSFGKYICVCSLCDRKLYQLYSERIIKMIKH